MATQPGICSMSAQLQEGPLMSEGEAWDEIARIAIKHRFIVHAYGGRMILATVAEQEKIGIHKLIADKHKTSEQKRREQEAVDDRKQSATRSDRPAGCSLY